MATNTLLSAGTTEATSADFTVAVGGSLDVYLTLAAGVETVPLTAEILIQKKTGSDYITVFRLNRSMPAAKISGAGTYRAKRGLSDSAVGANSET